MTARDLTPADHDEIDSITAKLIAIRGTYFRDGYFYQRLARRIYISRMNGNRYGDLCSL